MNRDFIKVGDAFNYEGRQFTVLGIPTPRSLDLGLRLGGKLSHRFTTTSTASVYWDKVARAWCASDGFLSPYVLTVTCGRCRGSQKVLTGYGGMFGPTPADCPDCGGQGRVALEED